MQTCSGSPDRSSAGFGLVELMIALLLTTILAAGIGQVFLLTGRTYRVHNNLARMQEHAHHALETLKGDLRRSGYLGTATGLAAIMDSSADGLRNGQLVAIDHGRCRDINWVRMLSHTVFGLDDHRNGYDCLPAEQNHRGDVLVTRYVRPLFMHGGSDTRAPLAGDDLYLVTSGFAATLTEGRHLRSRQYVGKPGMTGALVAHGYFLRGRHAPAGADCTTGHTLPALYRMIASNGRLRAEEVARGIEQFQVQFGIDMNGDHTVDDYNNAMEPNDPRWQQVIAVRIWLLARAECPETGYDNEHHYRMGNIVFVPAINDLDGDGAIDGDIDGDGNDDYRRRLLTATVALRNNPDAVSVSRTQ